jgi:Family of unknown function (DUF5372)
VHFASVDKRTVRLSDPLQRSPLTRWRLPSVPPDLWWSGQTLQTTLASNPSLGWALITHPFHPLKGQRFAIRKIRKVAGREVFSLYDEQRGSLPIPRDWTDQAVLSADAGLIEPAPILDARCLLKLHDLVRVVTKRIDDE